MFGPELYSFIAILTPYFKLNQTSLYLRLGEPPICPSCKPANPPQLGMRSRPLPRPANTTITLPALKILYSNEKGSLIVY